MGCKWSFRRNCEKPQDPFYIFSAKDDIRSREQAMMAVSGDEQAGDLWISGGSSMQSLRAGVILVAGREADCYWI